MINAAKKDLCCGCGTCAVVCPKKCIIMSEDKEGFLYPVVDSKACINCGLCERICPERKYSTSIISNMEPVVYAAYNNSLDERIKASSGGIFSVLAKKIIQCNGVVVGVCLTDDCNNVRFETVSNIEGLNHLYGSKYIQAEAANIFVKVKSILVSGKAVLFSGTPCQIVALQNFLGKQYSNLYTVDLACHGVASHSLWIKYLAFIEKKKKGKTKEVQFRNKRVGWKHFSLFIRFDNGKIFHQICYDNPFMQFFFNNLSLRKSCYECKYRTLERISDITLADFWGVDSTINADDKGVSLVLCNTQKGQNLFDSCSTSMVSYEKKIEEAIAKNPGLNKKIVIPTNRNEFLKKAEYLSIKELQKEFVKDTTDLKTRIKRLLAEAGIRKL